MPTYITEEEIGKNVIGNGSRRRWARDQYSRGPADHLLYRITSMCDPEIVFVTVCAAKIREKKNTSPILESGAEAE